MNLEFIKRRETRFFLCILFVIWIISMSFNYGFLGIREGGDTEQYTDAAKNILEETPAWERDSLFLTYNWFLAGAFYLELPYEAVAFIQAFLSFCAAILLFFVGKSYFNTFVGFFASLLFLINVEVQRWNFYILPEAFATAFLIILVSSFLLAQKNKKWYLAAVPFGVITLFIRPEIAYFFFPITLYCLWKNKKPFKLLGVFFLVLFILFAFRVSYHAESSYGILDQWKEGQYIWPEYTLPLTQDSVLLNAQEENQHLWQFFLLALWHEPLWLMKLFAYRLFYFMFHVRPFYSPLHNAFGFLSSSFTFFFATLGFFLAKKSRKEIGLFFGLFFMQTALVLITCVDWDGRWWSRVISFLLIPAAIGIEKLGYLKWWTKIVEK